ncbi:unnamed protein product [Miscanthus lutarioriparius]|uniref:Uncharacterized protein n=1 Tax=Miscanthus lutarioriparius TaxID=422564 RepID=A0A811NSA4_9POAL|nr:unnamed protein product [Miscanthus lutarioriparius]
MADLCVPSDYGLPEMADLDHSHGSRHLEVARRPIRPLLRPGSRWRPLRPDEEDLLPVEEKISASIHHSCLVVGGSFENYDESRDSKEDEVVELQNAELVPSDICHHFSARCIGYSLDNADLEHAKPIREALTYYLCTHEENQFLLPAIRDIAEQYGIKLLNSASTKYNRSSNSRNIFAQYHSYRDAEIIAAEVMKVIIYLVFGKVASYYGIYCIVYVVKVTFISSPTLL